MPAWEALQSLITLLKTIPAGVVTQDHIGLRRPSALGDLPRIVVSAREVQSRSAGIGGLVGSRQVSSTSWSSDSGIWTSGIFGLELWATDEPTLTALATAVFRTVEGSAAGSAAGFGKLAAQSAGPMEVTLLDGAQSGGNTSLRLLVECSFSYEAVSPVQTGPDGIIKRVHVDVKGDVNEAMDLP